jgi:two-component system chemotaxis response regulator CheB
VGITLQIAHACREAWGNCMSGHDIIVVGASAGGVEALSNLARGLPGDLPAAVFAVLHVSAHGTSVMPRILSRAGALPAAHARDGEAIEPGRIYVAPPDHHLLVKRGHVRVARGPRENGARPAVDPLFRTAARFYGSRVIGVVLSGALDDGTAGLQAVKRRGGIAVVQDPQDALYPGMPRSAMEQVTVDHVLPMAEIPALLARLAREPAAVGGAVEVSNEMEIETDMAELEMDAVQRHERPGAPAGFGCPECGGALWELREGEMLHFRCRVGHAWSAGTLLAAQSDALEVALWTALRALEESAALSQRVVERLRTRGSVGAATRFEAQARDAAERAALIRDVLLQGEPGDTTEPVTTEGDSRMVVKAERIENVTATDKVTR